MAPGRPVSASICSAAPDRTTAATAIGRLRSPVILGDSTHTATDIRSTRDAISAAWSDPSQRAIVPTARPQAMTACQYPSFTRRVRTSETAAAANMMTGTAAHIALGMSMPVGFPLQLIKQ